MTSKKSFVLYLDQKEFFESLDPQDCKDLILSIFDYPQQSIKLSPMASAAFISIKNQLKRDLNRWENILSRNIENGKKGGRPRKLENPKKQREKRLLTVMEAAIHIGIDVETLYRWIRAGNFPVVKVGERRKMIDPNDLMEWINARKSGVK